MWADVSVSLSYHLSVGQSVSVYCLCLPVVCGLMCLFLYLTISLLVSLSVFTCCVWADVSVSLSHHLSVGQSVSVYLLCVG